MIYDVTEICLHLIARTNIEQDFSNGIMSEDFDHEHVLYPPHAVTKCIDVNGMRMIHQNITPFLL